MRLQFLGANRQVTGSRYRLDAGGLCLLVDCGLFQERCCLDRNWAPSPVPPGEIDHVLLTHAHLDHCGLLPKLVQEGYAGPVLATPPSIDLARLVLEDAARIQEEDAAYKKRRHQREGRRGPHPEVPLYTAEDADRAVARLRPVQYGTPVALNDAVAVQYHDAGHILGSASIEVTVREGATARRIVFSGDVGQRERPLSHPPTRFREADAVVLESTYGDRDHADAGGLLDELAEIVNGTVERGGNVVIPTFAIDRAQELLYHFSRLVREERIPRLTIFLDSPMAVDATTIYKRYAFLLDDETQRLLSAGEHPFQFPGLHFVRSRNESQSINSIRGSCVIMAGSGMCTGGRIKHHLRRNIDRPESTILFVGYQAEDTLGRHLVDGDERVRIHGRHYDVRAPIRQLSGLSAHAGRRDLLHWLEDFSSPPALFLTHGEAAAADHLAESVRARPGWSVTVPAYEDTVDL